MKISVIIPTYNEENHISECLDSLSTQTYQDYEIIVVDDGSTDKTASIIKSKKVKMYSQEHLGAGPARNLGSKNAKGEILVFIDADMTFDHQFLDKLTQPIIKKQTNGTFTLEEKVKNWDSYISKIWNFETTKSLSNNRLPLNHPKTAKVFRAILKSEFDRVGGYDEVGYNDDWTLSKKLGYKAVAVNGAIMYHNNPETFKQVFHQSRWIGGREYKLGEFGKIIAFIRATFPISIFLGIIRTIKTKYLLYIPFKIIYDFGILMGILKYWLGGGSAQ